MPKTLGLTIIDKTGKKYHGVAADSYIIYNKCHGLPAYTLMVSGATLFFASLCLAGYNKVKRHVQNKKDSEPLDNEPASQ